MYFKINIILITLAYQCFNVAVCYSKNETDRQFCYVKMPSVDPGYMPIIFQGNTTRPTIIRPDGNGHFIFKHNSQIKLSCAGSIFIAPMKFSLSEISIICVDGFLRYRGKPYYISAFKCKDVPIASLKLSRFECNHSENNSVIEVGFQTKNTFLRSYRICFDMIYKRSFYSWYYVNSPTIKINQIQITKPKFTETRLFDGLNLTTTYFAKNQKEALSRSLNSTIVAQNYLTNRFLTAGHLTSPDEFAYVFEQHATYFFENTVPHWSELNNRIWKLLERLFRRNLIRGSSRHLIVSGSYGTLTLPDENGVEQPLYLATNERLPIPKFIWKMDYDIDRKSGTVFIGYNHPNIPLDKSLHFCNTVPCPGDLSKQDNSDLLFCCTKESFEEAYGLLDYYLFRPF